MNNNEKTYKLGEFAELTGVSRKSLQRWDKNGTLVADRTDGCHRSYSQKHIEQLHKLQSENSSKLTRKKNYRFKDLTDMYFGKLHVIERADDWIGANGHRHIQWLCECKCGNKVVIKGASLLAGYNKSCGCLRYGDNETKQMWSEYYEMSPEEALKEAQNKPLPDIVTVKKEPHYGRYQDLTDMHFGLWRVIQRAETRHYKSGGQAVCWLCQCECGTIKSVPGRDLKSGASQSCGCMGNMSWLEYHTKQYLMDHHILFEYQKKYENLQGVGGKLLSYDFVIIVDDQPYCIIECQGEQHYRPIKKFGGAKQFLKQQIHDDLKKQYAEKVLHIPLFEILYTCMTQAAVYECLDKIFVSRK